MLHRTSFHNNQINFHIITVAPVYSGHPWDKWFCIDRWKLGICDWDNVYLTQLHGVLLIDVNDMSGLHSHATIIGCNYYFVETIL